MYLSTAEHCQGLFDLIESAPTLEPSIKSLRLFDKGVFIQSSWIHHGTLLPILLSKLRNIQWFTLAMREFKSAQADGGDLGAPQLAEPVAQGVFEDGSGGRTRGLDLVRWNKFSPALVSSLHKIFTSPKLRRLQLDNLIDFPMEVLHDCAATDLMLTYLQSSVRRPKPSRPLPPEPALLRLQRLSVTKVHSPISPVLNFVTRAQSSLEVTTLRNLSISTTLNSIYELKHVQLLLETIAKT